MRPVSNSQRSRFLLLPALPQSEFLGNSQPEESPKSNSSSLATLEPSMFTLDLLNFIEDSDNEYEEGIKKHIRQNQGY